ncbi:recombinase family protein [Pantoea agglomerans]
MPQLYSYIRWSSEKQTKSTSLERQLASARGFASEHNLEMVEIIEPSLSAFRGKNLDGKLGDFIDAVVSGAIPSDSWLYVENLDRLSRADVEDALGLFLKLLKLGLTIVTGMDKKTYNSKSIRKNPTDLMISILMFIRGNEESATKLNRTVGNVEALIERHKQGLPVNIKSCGKHPFWIDDTGPQYESVKPHPEYWNIAREAIELFLEGHGIYRVKRHLDERYPNGLKGKEWDYQVLKRMRESRALIGERRIKLIESDNTLKNYYPTLCKNETEYLKLQELKVQNRSKSKKDADKENIKLLSGLTILRCNKCGGTMNGFMNKGKPRYICTNGRHRQKNCIGWSVTAPLVEHCVMIALLIGYMDASRKDGKDTTEITDEITTKKEAIVSLENSISNISTAIEQGGNIPQLVSRLKILAEDRETLIKQTQRLNERKILYESKGSFEVNMIDFMEMIQWGVLMDYRNDQRNKIRSVISSIIELVLMDKNDGCLTIKIKCSGIDEIFVFTGVNRKPFWKFYVDFSNPEIDYLLERVTIERKEVIGDRVEELKKVYKNYYDLIVKELLSVVGYPDIDGANFWPNT